MTSYGFLGHVRNIVPEHCILESKPEPAPLEDLRLANPWPELLEYASFIGSTAALLRYSKESDCDTFIVATEST